MANRVKMFGYMFTDRILEPQKIKKIHLAAFYERTPASFRKELDRNNRFREVSIENGCFLANDEGVVYQKRQYPYFIKQQVAVIQEEFGSVSLEEVEKIMPKIKKIIQKNQKIKKIYNKKINKTQKKRKETLSAKKK